MKKRQKKIDGFRKKLMIPESEILEYPELEVKLKIGRKNTRKIFCSDL